MSGFGEIDLLAAIAKPDYGIITNIGDSHLEFLGSRENVFKAKSEIIKHVKAKMFFNGDDPFLGRSSWNKSFGRRQKALLITEQKI